MNDQHEDIRPAEGTDRKFRVTDDGKLAEREDEESADFEEDLTFD